MTGQNGFVPSRYQTAIFEWVARGTGHAVVNAVAGSGKSTVLEQATKLMQDDFVVLAFNVHIRDEMNRRFRTPHAKTIHQLGLGMLHRHFARSMALEVNPRKLLEITESIVIENIVEDEHYETLRDAVRELASFTKKSLVNPKDAKALEDLAYQHEIGDADQDVIERAVELVPKVLERCRQNLDSIDFDDMIWLPHVLGLQPRTYGWVLLDEAQDLSEAQRTLAIAASEGGGRVLCAGDPNQSCYGFAGADTQSIQKLVQKLGAIQLPLSICYRCPSSHVALAKKLVPEIESRPDAPVGETGDLKFDDMIETAQPGDMVLCRTNAPLVDVATSLTAEGKIAIIKGADIGERLIVLVGRLRRKARSLDDVLGALEDYRVQKCAELEKKGRNLESANLSDRIGVIKKISESCMTVQDLKRAIRATFGEGHDGIVLSTVHRAKGLEQNRIFIYRPELMPHPLAKNQEEKAQEKNIEYISLTRAKQAMWFVEEMGS